MARIELGAIARETVVGLGGAAVTALGVVEYVADKTNLNLTPERMTLDGLTGGTGLVLLGLVIKDIAVTIRNIRGNNGQESKSTLQLPQS